MRKASIFFSVILLTWGFYMTNGEVFGQTPMQEKIEVLKETEILRNSSDINKKTEKNLDLAIKSMIESLDSELWEDESSLKFKHGKKIFKNEENAVKKLENILDDKKESSLIKEQILNKIIRLVDVDKILAENAINDAKDVIMSEKGVKKLNKAMEEFDEGLILMENTEYVKAIKKFEKSWSNVKDSFKEKHVKKMKMIEFEGTDDFNFDGIPDVYLKLLDAKKPDKPKQIQIKITGECVNGENHDDAKMKIGFSTPVPLSTEFFDEEFTATNKWFKKNDPDKKINPAVITTVAEHFSFPVSGDDLIQKNTGEQKGSFEFLDKPISEIGDQTGWEGEFDFVGEPGEYFLRFWLPLTEPTNQGDSCNFVSGFSIRTTINP